MTRKTGKTYVQPVGRNPITFVQWPFQRSMYVFNLSEAITAKGTRWTPAAFGSAVKSASSSESDSQRSMAAFRESQYTFVFSALAMAEVRYEWDGWM